MEEKLFKIGDVAQLLDLTPQALRYYEQQHVITPVKRASGTRYYTAYDVHRLLAFRKYRTADFPIQDIVAYMRDRDIRARIPWMREKSGELLAESERLYRRARALDYYRMLIERALASAGKYRVGMRPDGVIQKARWEDVATLSERELADVRAFLDAMPVTSLGFTAMDSTPDPPSYRLVCEFGQALSWQLPLENTVRMTPVPCVTTCLVCPSDFEVQAALDEALRAVGTMGHKRDLSQPIVCVLITADTSVTPYRTYIRCYILILT